MVIFRYVADLVGYLEGHRALGARVGFIPTMGALHGGHRSLVEQCNIACDISVVSIFINPAQFNDSSDLEKYPRTPELDIVLLEGCGCDVLFMPSVEEVYPPGVPLTEMPVFGDLADVMEGVFRPGHFQGMARVVCRLLEITSPDYLYMGQKDFQQLSIVREMVRLLDLRVRLVMCPTIREADGLAMSSRNMRLTREEREMAVVIYAVLIRLRDAFGTTDVDASISAAWTQMEQAGLRPEYIEIVDGLTLKPIRKAGDSDYVVACVAAWAGRVRLIDNILIRGEPGL